MTTDIAVADDQPASLLNIIAQASRDPGADVVKLQALLQMHRDHLADEAKAKFTQALHAVQGAIPAVEKNGTIDLGKGRPIPFMTYEDMSRVLKPLMDANGLAISFDMQRADGGTVTTALLEHRDGHSRTYALPLPIDTGPGRNPLQAMGSTLSYSRRYLCEMVFNIVRKGADDDGASGGTKVITAAQLREIEDLLADTGADRDGFLQFVGAKSTDMIPAAAYTAAINTLVNRREAQKRRAEKTQ